MHLQKEDEHRRQVEDEHRGQVEEKNNDDRMTASPHQEEVCLHPAQQMRQNKIMSRHGKKVVSLIPNHAVKVKLHAAIKPAPWHEKKRAQLKTVRKLPPWHKHSESEAPHIGSRWL
jgi:hypothetical protein